MTTTNRIPFTAALTAFAAVAALAAAGQAFAAAEGAPAQVRVSYGDLNLASLGGRAALEHRVQVAVGRVCGDAPMLIEMDRQASWSTCRRAAWTGARQQMAAIYKGQNLADASVSVRGR